MSKENLTAQTMAIKPGDHLVALYSQEQEIIDYVAAFIESALAQNARCIYITGDMSTEAVLRRLPEVETLVDSGELIILDHVEAYTQNGVFAPDSLIRNLEEFAQDALEVGYMSLAITGELSWMVDYGNAEELIAEYEWKLNDSVFKNYPVSALCRYNLSKFSHEMIRSIIELHPIILWQHKIHENPYYIPPHALNGRYNAQHQVQTWLENIDRFTDEQSRFESIFARKQQELRQLHEDMTGGIIAAFLKLLETHDPYTKDHCTHVASLAVRMAEELQLDPEFKAKIYYAALVHDIGKALIPKEILNKPGLLTGDEYEYIKLHPVYGSQALGQVKALQDIALAVRHHHERYDGRGYPDGLQGTDIPLMARMIAICDSYDAMTNDRPYRKAAAHEEALAEILAQAGRQFDPELVKAFTRLFSEESVSSTA